MYGPVKTQHNLSKRLIFFCQYIYAHSCNTFNFVKQTYDLCTNFIVIYLKIMLISCDMHAFRCESLNVHLPHFVSILYLRLYCTALSNISVVTTRMLLT